MTHHRAHLRRRSLLRSG
jgi:hypothetical protein